MVPDEESSFLTTVNSPFGRFRSTGLPFGLCVSQDIFQQKCPGTVGIADDIAVRDNTEERHDADLHDLMYAGCMVAMTCFQPGQISWYLL